MLCRIAKICKIWRLYCLQVISFNSLSGQFCEKGGEFLRKVKMDSNFLGEKNKKNVQICSSNDNSKYFVSCAKIW